MRKQNLKEKALQLKQRYEFLVFPLIGKEPAITDWLIYTEKGQEEWEVKKLFNRNDITGIGIILANDLIGLDIDGNNELNFLYDLLESMGKPKDYHFVVKTKRGFHIYFYCKDFKGLEEKFGINSAKKFKFKPDITGKEIELKISNGYFVAPGSEHPKGGEYIFINGLPETKPEEISVDVLSTAIKQISIINTDLSYAKKTSEGTKTINSNGELTELIRYLKKYKLDQDQWIECGYSLASLGEKGREYFIDLSLNDFYNDSLDYLNKKFDYLLQHYKMGGATLATLYQYAIQRGYKYESKSSSFSKIFYEFELCALSYPEKRNNKPEILFSYAMVKKLKSVFKSKKKVMGKLKGNLERIGISKTVDHVLNEYHSVKEYVNNFMNRNGKEPYCRVGEEYFTESLEGKFDYLSFALLGAVTAIQGKRDKYKFITKERLRCGMLGYKSVKVMKKELSENLVMSDYQIRERAKKLRAKQIISYITVFRNTYYSTFLNQNDLERIASSKYVKKATAKKESQNIQHNFNTELSKKMINLGLRKLKKVNISETNEARNLSDRLSELI